MQNLIFEAYFFPQLENIQLEMVFKENEKLKVKTNHLWWIYEMHFAGNKCISLKKKSHWAILVLE